MSVLSVSQRYKGFASLSILDPKYPDSGATQVELFSLLLKGPTRWKNFWGEQDVEPRSGIQPILGTPPCPALGVPAG